MNENIRAIFLLYEAVALAIIKPLYDSIRHSRTLLSKNLTWFQTSGCHSLTNGSFLQMKPPANKDEPFKAP